MSSEEPRIDFFKERIFPVLFMLLITVVFIALVSGIYLGTRESVLRNERLYLKRAVLFAANVAAPEDAVAAEEVYFSNIEEQQNEEGEVLYYRVVDTQGRQKGYVLPMEGPGLWGEIEAVVGMSRDLSTLTGVDFIKQNETPGLGARISEVWFREQFRGKTGPFSLVPEGTEGENKREFDAITGATITSTAVRNMLNKSLKEAPDMVKER